MASSEIPQRIQKHLEPIFGKPERLANIPQSEFFNGIDSLQQKNRNICLGMDPKIDEMYVGEPEQLSQYNCEVLDATHDTLSSIKLNLAFYLLYGSEGIRQMEKTFEYAKEKYPEIQTILDCKAVDVPHTAEAYSSFAFDTLKADAITISPIMGQVESFKNRRDKGIFVICRSTNDESYEYQTMLTKLPDPEGRPKDTSLLGEYLDRNKEYFKNAIEQPFYLRIARDVWSRWNENGNYGLVVGANFADTLRKIRGFTDNLTFLSPGVGAQRANTSEAFVNGRKKDNTGIILNASRSIYMASKNADYDVMARREAERLNNEINSLKI